MAIPLTLPDLASQQQPITEMVDRQTRNVEPNIGMRLEQMLWTEMLSHSGLEKAFTLGGGEGASAFSRFLVEEIAKDLADKHPLGLGDALNLGGGRGSQIKASESHDEQ